MWPGRKCRGYPVRCVQTTVPRQATLLRWRLRAWMACVAMEPRSICCVSRPRERISRLRAVEKIHTAAQVRNNNRTAYHQPHAEYLEELIAGYSRVAAFGDVVTDAVVAAQHERGDQTHHFLGLGRQRAGLVG